MHIVCVNSLPAQLWRNGGGLTRLIAVGRAGQFTQWQAASPPLPHLDDTDWRISLADITADGPFSCFPGFDRYAVLIGDGAVRLSGPTGSACALPLTPLAFPGEAELVATRESAIAGLAPTAPHQFLNLMLKRQTMRSTIKVIDQAIRPEPAALLFVLVIGGEWSFRMENRHIRIVTGEAGLHTMLPEGTSLMPLQDTAKALVITLQPLA